MMTTTMMMMMMMMVMVMMTKTDDDDAGDAGDAGDDDAGDTDEAEHEDFRSKPGPSVAGPHTVPASDLRLSQVFTCGRIKRFNWMRRINYMSKRRKCKGERRRRGGRWPAAQNPDDAQDRRLGASGRGAIAP